MSEPEFASALRRLIARAGGDASRVRVEQQPRIGDAAATGSFHADGGTLTLRATDLVAAASAFAHYLQSHGQRLTWESPVIAPRWDAWPDAPETAQATGFGIRYHLNVVTHGYSTAYWDWARWERELDWMALHGVTHPLVLTAYEVVLAEALYRSGVGADEARAWVGGAATIPWMAMGGLHDFGGPLSPTWATRRVELARRILARTRDLGMTPVLPVTGGHVPASLAGEGSAEIDWQGWRTPLLAPASPDYANFARTFLEAQRDLLGDAGAQPWFAVDPYIESLPPSGDLDDLARAGAGVHRALTSVHPRATWLLQGWPFHYHRGFWSRERIAAYLSGVPRERLVLIDLWGEHAPMWREGMHGRRWLWTAVHNFGGRFALFGDVRGLARDIAELAARHPDGLEGVGLAPEAIENNTVFYEAAADAVWRELDVDEWLAEFAVQRYGVDDPGAREAWRLLGATLYAPGRTRSIPSPVIARPWTASAPFATQRLAGEALPAEPARMSANIDAENDPAVEGDLPAIARAARLLIGLDELAVHRDALERDVVELTGHVVAQQFRQHIRGVLGAWRQHDAPALRDHAMRLQDDLRALDDLVATRPESRASTWITAARSWGGDPDEADIMEHDARSLVSVWGHQTSGLHDYSGRHWSGLVRDLYAPRWAAWTDWLADAAERGSAPDERALQERIVHLEESWRTAVGSEDGSSAAPLTVAAATLDRLGLCAGAKP
ncbi:alpha-N-acetylglucosaminidase [Microbacterium hibisci]|uniref:alpha-N-acetylglucosaminidase n=1 Tax=Microbacterium hibisci TaxID=2036000 RepID=UPI0019457854|nr:alpha-N-acetylglucosaminidase [Microbacterium hibisci]